jgi:hypothetical protein
MGLFGNKNDNAAAQPTPASHSAPRHSSSSDHSPRRGGFFNRNRTPSPDHRDSRQNSRLSHGSTRSSGGLFNRNAEDPSIMNARQRVASAESAEREADRALVQARTAVREARDQVKVLEREAAEEYVFPEMAFCQLELTINTELALQRSSRTKREISRREPSLLDVSTLDGRHDNKPADISFLGHDHY